LTNTIRVIPPAYGWRFLTGKELSEILPTIHGLYVEVSYRHGSLLKRSLGYMATIFGWDGHGDSDLGHKIETTDSKAFYLPNGGISVYNENETEGVVSPEDIVSIKLSGEIIYSTGHEKST